MPLRAAIAELRPYRKHLRCKIRHGFRTSSTETLKLCVIRRTYSIKKHPLGADLSFDDTNLSLSVAIPNRLPSRLWMPIPLDNYDHID